MPESNLTAAALRPEPGPTAWEKCCAGPTRFQRPQPFFIAEKTGKNRGFKSRIWDCLLNELEGIAVHSKQSLALAQTVATRAARRRPE